MRGKERVRRANSHDSLDRMLGRIGSGQEPMPDWIELQGECRIDGLVPARRADLLARLHGSVCRGFRCPNTKLVGPERLAYWRHIAGAGFHDFSGAGWVKNHASPWVESQGQVP